jgi:hypothetical protein
MKFTISKAALQDLLNVVVSAVPAKSTLPILSHILIEADKEGLTFIATDLDISIRTKGDAEVKPWGGHRSHETDQEIVRAFMPTCTWKSRIRSSSPAATGPLSSSAWIPDFLSSPKWTRRRR